MYMYSFYCINIKITHFYAYVNISISMLNSTSTQKWRLMANLGTTAWIKATVSPS